MIVAAATSDRILLRASQTRDRLAGIQEFSAGTVEFLNVFSGHGCSPRERL